MFVRLVLGAVLAVSMVGSAGAMTPEEARQFVSGKVFSFRCSDGTRGDGAFLDDGGVFGNVAFSGEAPRSVRLPERTIQVRGSAVCASVKGMPFDPCFNLEKSGSQSFRGAVAGVEAMYCDFVQRPDLAVAKSTRRPRLGSQ